MHGVGLGRDQNDFRVAGKLDGARLAGKVTERNTPVFDIVFGRNRDLGVGVQTSVASPEFGARQRKNRFIVFRLDATRLKSDRPFPPGRQVVDIDEGARNRPRSGLPSSG